MTQMSAFSRRGHAYEAAALELTGEGEGPEKLSLQPSRKIGLCEVA